jgi:hypothetical protein
LLKAKNGIIVLGGSTMSKIGILALYLGLGLATACGGSDEVLDKVDMKMTQSPSSGDDLATPDMGSDMKGCSKDLDCSWLKCLDGKRAVCLQPSIPPGGERFCSCR